MTVENAEYTTVAVQMKIGYVGVLHAGPPPYALWLKGNRKGKTTLHAGGCESDEVRRAQLSGLGFYGFA